MKRNKRVALLSTLALLSGAILMPAEAQQPVLKRTTKLRTGETQTASSDTLSQRVRLQNLDLEQSTDAATWMRTIYRQLDLSKDANAALYYPTKTTEQAQNLFAQIFKLIGSDRINVYEYLDGEEIFTPEYKVQFKELLDRFRINYTEGKGRGEATYNVANADIPSSEVKSYYLKETWYFDAATSTYDVKVDALCPILYDLGDYGEVAMPLFWVPYQEIKPFISTTPVMLSSYNNKPSATLDDFFRLKMYDGEIIKTKNLQGRALAQYVATPDSLQAERVRIERQLTDFKKSLFVACQDDAPADSVAAATSPRTATSSAKGTNSRDKRVRSTKASAQSKAAKVKAPKAPKTPKVSKPASSGRSVRGRI